MSYRKLERTVHGRSCQTLAKDVKPFQQNLQMLGVMPHRLRPHLPCAFFDFTDSFFEFWIPCHTHHLSSTSVHLQLQLLTRIALHSGGPEGLHSLFKGI